MKTSRWFVAAMVGAACGVTSFAASAHRITIAPDDVERAGQVISFSLPESAKGARGLRAASGTLLLLQVDADGTAWCLVPAQKAGETLTFTLANAPAGADGIEVAKGKTALEIKLGGKPAVAYQMDKEALPRSDIKPEYKRAGYLHPVFTPSGTIVSDHYPPQHLHQHGIFAPWTETRFQGRTVDFWNMGKKLGTVEFAGLDRTWNGPVHGGFVARHKFIDLAAPGGPVTVLNETWDVRAYHLRGASSPVQLFDLTITQSCATNDPLILPKYHYGGLGFRGRGEWFGKDKASFLTSEGTTDRVAANHERMRWVHLSGAVDGGVAGLAILGHPGNFRAPQPVRVHPNEPYVSWTPSQLGDWQIEPGKPYVARFRFIAADGPPDRARLDAFWNGYARPATVKVQPAP